MENGASNEKRNQNSIHIFQKQVAKTIRAKCLDCSVGSANEVKMCPVEDCSLWKFRFGKLPE